MKLSVVVVGVIAGLLGLGMSSSSPDQSPQKKGVGNAKTKTSQTTYTCPMHPEVVSNKPGKCSKCGMSLQKKRPSPIRKQEQVFVCPMHPEVTSNKPGECPKCGMDLEKK